MGPLGNGQYGGLSDSRVPGLGQGRTPSTAKAMDPGAARSGSVPTLLSRQGWMASPRLRGSLPHCITKLKTPCWDIIRWNFRSSGEFNLRVSLFLVPAYAVRSERGGK